MEVLDLSTYHAKLRPEVLPLTATIWVGVRRCTHHSVYEHVTAGLEHCIPSPTPRLGHQLVTNGATDSRCRATLHWTACRVFVELASGWASPVGYAKNGLFAAVPSKPSTAKPIREAGCVRHQRTSRGASAQTATRLPSVDATPRGRSQHGLRFRNRGTIEAFSGSKSSSPSSLERLRTIGAKREQTKPRDHTCAD